MERCRTRKRKSGKCKAARERARQTASQLSHEMERGQSKGHISGDRVRACVRVWERQQCEIKGGGEMNTEEETEECSGAQQQRG